jgi:hypothetical protein
MSFSKKTDVKNHLSRRIRKNILPFKPVTGPDSTGYSIEEHNRSSMRTFSAVLPRDENAVAATVIRKLPA